MAFWKLAYTMKWIDTEKLRIVVKTEDNPFGEITETQYKEITGIDF